MGAGKGGDGGGEEDAAAPEAAQPVVLRVDLHCAGCAHKVKKAIKRVPGVDSIVTDVATNRVVVAGTADAGVLKARLEAKTNKPVEVISAGSGGGAPKKAPATEPKQQAAQGDKGVSGPKEEGKEKEKEKEKEKKQEPAAEEEKKPKQQETTVLLKIRLHCDGCADRIRRRIYKIKGVKEVVVDGNGKKDEVQVTGTMDVPHMVSYLKEKLNRDVEAVPAPAPAAKKDGGGGGEGKDDKKDSSGDKNRGLALAGGDDKTDKGKGIEVGGPSTAAAAAFMAAPAGASTYHVAPPYGYVAYQQQPPPPPAAAGYYPAPAYPYYAAGGNGDGGMAHHPYYQQVQQQQQQQDGYGNQQPQMAYPPYPYRFDMAPPPQLFSDENPNACSVM